MGQAIRKAIRSLRESREETQGDLGRALGYTVPTVCRWETRAKWSGVVLLKQIADHYGVDLIDLIEGA
jgi:transcriptional regulator with XRE-family HTH domain